jgi:hypothetical protein
MAGRDSECRQQLECIPADPALAVQDSTLVHGWQLFKLHFEPPEGESWLMVWCALH